MKQATSLKLKPLSGTELKSLCSETREEKLTEKQFKTFSVVDLWAIQKNSKPAGLKRSLAL